MSPKTKRKISKNIEARILPYGVFMLLVIASISAVFFVLPPYDKIVSAGENQYSYYKQINIDHDYISADLTNFPVLIHLDADEDMYDHVLANLSDIAFFDSSNTTQFNHEVEYYDIGGGTVDAYIWVNVTSVSSTVDTVFFLYYDDADGGYPTSYNPGDVWDSNFMMVHHLGGSQDTDCDDSTDNNNDVKSDLGTPVYQQTGVAGYGVTFAKASSEGLKIDDSTSLDITSYFTAECWIKPTTTGAGMKTFAKYDHGIGDERSWTIGVGADTTIIFSASKDGTSGNLKSSTSSDTVSTDSWHYTVGFHDDSTGFIYSKLSETVSTGVDLTGDIHPGDANVSIGCSLNSGAWYGGFDGVIDECRISNVLRNDSWLNATFHTVNESTDFLTFGTATVNEYTSTLSPSATTHQGEQGNTTYSNESGTAYTWLMWNLTDGTEYLRINITNMPSNITSANFSYQFTSDNSSWNKAGNWKSGSAGGWSFIMNNTTWTNGNGCYGSNIFTVDDDSDTIYEVSGWTEVWCVEKCVIPTGIGNETYTDTEGTKPTWDSGRYS